MNDANDTDFLRYKQTQGITMLKDS